MRTTLIILLTILLGVCAARAEQFPRLEPEFFSDGSCTDIAELKPHPLLQLIRQKEKDHRKLTAAILAFPFPFGIVGIHRIFLGTAPYVPVVYIATAGGVFGLLPLIDFIMILAEKDITRFAGNRQVFMWVE